MSDGLDVELSFNIDRDDLRELSELGTPAMLEENTDPSSGVTVEVWVRPPAEVDP